MLLSEINSWGTWRDKQTISHRAISQRDLPIQMRLTLTYDQGREMAQHSLFTKMTGVKVFFAYPASPQERGTNESTNGLIRQFFPKGTDFNIVTRKEIKHVRDSLNGRPRKVLDWDCPYKAFEKLAGVALKIDTT